jgi:Fungal specific transcription factor domain
MQENIVTAVQRTFGPYSAEDILEIRIEAMFSDVELFLKHYTGVDVGGLPTNVSDARALLAAPSVLRFIDLFFDEICPHFHFYHAPSFNPLTVSIPLLFAVTLCGAALSGETAMVSMARKLFNTLECFVFQQAVFISDSASTLGIQGVEKELQQLEEIQASYCAILLQEWEGSTEAKARIRQLRYTTLAEVKRLQ